MIPHLPPIPFGQMPWGAMAQRQSRSALEELLGVQAAYGQVPLPQMPTGPLVSQQEAGMAGAVALLARLFGARDPFVQAGLGQYLGGRSQIELSKRQGEYQQQVLAHRQAMDGLSAQERAARERLRSAERVSDRVLNRVESHSRDQTRHQQQLDLQRVRGEQSAGQASHRALMELLRANRSPEQIAAARASGMIELPDEAWESLLASARAGGSGAGSLGAGEFPEPQAVERHPALERVLEARAVRESFADAARRNAALVPAQRRVETGSIWVFIDQNDRKHAAAAARDDRTAMAMHDRDLERHIGRVNQILMDEIEKDSAKVRALRARPNPSNDAQAEQLAAAIAARQEQILVNLDLFASRLGREARTGSASSEFSPLDPFVSGAGILPTLPKLGQPSGAPSLRGAIGR